MVGLFKIFNSCFGRDSLVSEYKGDVRHHPTCGCHRPLGRITENNVKYKTITKTVHFQSGTGALQTNESPERDLKIFQTEHIRNWYHY